MTSETSKMFYRNSILMVVGLMLSFSVFAKKEAKDFLVPNELVQGYLKTYSPDEIEKINMDYANIRDLCFSQAKKDQKKLIYVGTAGGIGAGRSKILERYLRGRLGFVHIDPDQRGLKFMINTYTQYIDNYLISESLTYQRLKEAYAKWRDASDYIVNKILNEAYDKNFAIAYVTTSSIKGIDQFFGKLKNRNYKIILLLCGSSEENRLKAMEYKEKHQYFVQATPEELITKGRRFFDNFPAYFQLADEIQFYWTEDFFKGGVKVGDYSRKNGLKWSHEYYKKFVDSYESYRKKYNSRLPSFDALYHKGYI